jgi:predicted permease
MCILVALIYLRQIPLLRELRDLDLFEDPGEAKKRLLSVAILTTFFLAIATVAFLYLPIITSNPQDPVAAVLVIAFPTAYMLYSIYNTKRMGLDDIG